MMIYSYGNSYIDIENCRKHDVRVRYDDFSDGG
jgi:hypothetical protein